VAKFCNAHDTEADLHFHTSVVGGINQHRTRSPLQRYQVSRRERSNPIRRRYPIRGADQMRRDRLATPTCTDVDHGSLPLRTGAAQTGLGLSQRTARCL